MRPACPTTLVVLFVVASLAVGCAGHEPPAQWPAPPAPPAERDRYELSKRLRADIRDDDEIRIHVLNIGTGTCQLVECPGDDPALLLVDCGSTGATVDDMTREQAVDYVQGILDDGDYSDVEPVVVLSHPDADHSNYVPSVLPAADYQVASIWQGGVPGAYPAAVTTWIGQQTANGATLHNGFAAGYDNGGNPIPGIDCGDAQSFILTVNTGATRNDQSLVLMLRYGDFDAVFTGDATGATQTAAAGSGALRVPVTLLMGSHHGADTHGSNDAAWARATQPDAVVYSAGIRFHHPRCVPVANYDPFVIAADEHSLMCGEGGEWIEKEPEDAQYNTEDDGLVRVDADDDNRIEITCSRAMSCDVAAAASPSGPSDRAATDPGGDG